MFQNDTNICVKRFFREFFDLWDVIGCWGSSCQVLAWQILCASEECFEHSGLPHHSHANLTISVSLPIMFDIVFRCIPSPSTTNSHAKVVEWELLTSQSLQGLLELKLRLQKLRRNSPRTQHYRCTKYLHWKMKSAFCTVVHRGLERTVLWVAQILSNCQWCFGSSSPLLGIFLLSFCFSKCLFGLCFGSKTKF